MIATFLHFPTLERAWLGAYYVVLLLLAVYGIHRLVIVALYQFGRSRAPRELNTMKEWPRVTVQLPLFNELYVAERLLEAAAAIDYPAERLEIQVLDDSTDRTYEIVAGKVAELRRRGVAIVHLHRTDRQGFKAGALAAGLGSALGEFICVFDADFLPPRDLLKRSLPHFGAPEVGMVQARWTHLNRDYSLLSRAQALQLDAHTKAADLAESLGLSLSPFYRRIRMLEEAGVINQYVTLLDQEKAGFPVNAYVSVAIEKKSEARLAAFERAIANLDEVMECYLMTGAFDYMLRVVAADIAGIERFVMTRLTKVDGVRDIHTSVALRRVEYKTALPLRIRDE